MIKAIKKDRWTGNSEIIGTASIFASCGKTLDYKSEDVPLSPAQSISRFIILANTLLLGWALLSIWRHWQAGCAGKASARTAVLCFMVSSTLHLASPDFCRWEQQSFERRGSRKSPPHSFDQNKSQGQRQSKGRSGATVTLNLSSQHRGWGWRPGIVRLFVTDSYIGSHLCIYF